MITVDRTGDAQVLRQAADRELGLPIVIGQLAARLTQQLVGRHVAAGHAQQVALDTQTLVGHLTLAGDLAQLGPAYVTHAFLVQRLIHGGAHVADDAALLQRNLQSPIRRIGAHVGDRDHFDTLIVQIQCSEVTVIIAGQHYRALAGLDCVQPDQTLRGAGQHHTGQIIVAKNNRLVERATAHQALRSAHLVQTLALNHWQIVVGKPGIASGLCEDLNIGVRLHGVDQFAPQLPGTLTVDIEARVSQRTSEYRLLFDQQHPGSGVGCGQSRL